MDSSVKELLEGILSSAQRESRCRSGSRACNCHLDLQLAETATPPEGAFSSSGVYDRLRSASPSQQRPDAAGATGFDPGSSIVLRGEPAVPLQDLAQLLMGEAEHAKAIGTGHGGCSDHGVDDRLLGRL